MSTPIDPVPTDLRSRKRLATRQLISDVATRLFWEKGFDNVTIDEIAAAAEVGRMTVFNYFPRKEDMFFDREEEGTKLLVDALQQRDPAVPPIEALRLLAHNLQESHYLNFSEEGVLFIETITKSEPLKARARAIRDELVAAVTVALAQCVGRESNDPYAHLASNLLMATWSVAFIQAHKTFQESKDEAKAKVVFLDLVDKGSVGIAAAMAGTAYT